jgi:predicted ester cyclase
MSATEPANNKEIVRRFCDVINAGDPNLISKIIDEMVDPDVLFHAPVPTGTSGLEALKQAIAGFRKTYLDVHITIEDTIAEGDKVGSRQTVTRTNQGEFMGLPPTGKSLKYNEIFIFRIVNGQIAEVWGGC